jgi:pyruvate kinase
VEKQTLRRRTRIVATLGPATDRPGVLEKMLEAGLDVARINFSHGTAEEHLGRIARLRQLAAARGRPLAVLADLPGPKLRAILSAAVPLQPCQEVFMAAAASVSADIHVTEPQPIHELRPGQRVLLDDGRVQMRAVRCERQRVLLRVEVGGTLLPNKGINLPDTPLSIPAVTSRDLEALAVAATANVDWLALSFVRDPGAAHELRGAARALKVEAPLLAKIERPEAVKRAREIIEAFDGIMVARGDLGVEIPLEQVPHVQKRLIAQARAAGKPVVTATDMLDSMRTNPQPTRAEASDVANAVFDGTDAVMLSGETAVGDYPVEAVTCMDRIAREAEAHWRDEPPREVVVPRGDLQDHVTHLTVSLAREVKADAIITPTYSGRTPRMVARHRPEVSIVAPSPHESVLRQLAVVWGLSPVPLDPALTAGADRMEAAVRAAFAHGAVQAGTRAVVLAGHPIEGGEHFPTIRVVCIGEGGQSCEP